MKNNHKYDDNRMDFTISYEKYILNNGLEVVLHENHNNPIVAVAIQYHVGSNRELPGKTGFAHLFEHLLFQRSEHLKRNEFFSKISDLGGTFNGGTWEDGTIYFECVPNDALEKILWMESDRMGYFINTVTEKGIEREKDIVINEKRQTVDNKPYGFTENLICEALYPADHPYHWTVIGDMDDLRSATVEDVKDFYYRWYQPNNATIAISGDFDVIDTKHLIEKYFGEIKSTKKNATNKIIIPKLASEIRIMHEDSYANMPELNIVYPSPEQYNKDIYALDILTDLLSDGKKAPLYKEIVEKNIAPDISMSTSPREICGETTINIRTYPDINLDSAYQAVQNAFKLFEENGFDVNDIERYKKLEEINFYHKFSSNLYLAMNIAQYNVFGGSPDIIMKEIQMIRNVTSEDVMHVYEKYIKNKTFVATSFVPMGQANLALAGSVTAKVKEEKIDSQSMNSEEGAIVDDEPYNFSPSTFNRSIEPALSHLNNVSIPKVWTSKNQYCIDIYGITQNKLPLVNFTFVIKSGSIDCKKEKAGLARLTAKMLREGTALKTPDELEDAFRNFGTELNINTYKEYTSFNILCLNKDFADVIKLVEEVLTKPRWDKTEFARLLFYTQALIEQSLADPQRLGIDEFSKVIFGDNIIAMPIEGTKESVANITLEDLKEYYNQYYSPNNCSLIIAGSIDDETVIKAMKDFGKMWKTKDTPKRALPELKSKKEFLTTVSYPDAKQSFILIGKKAMGRNDPSFIPAAFANYKLGDGSGGQLFKILRLEHGYTYGAYSMFITAKNFGFFRAYTNVQSSVTQESLDLFKDIIANYGKTYTEEDVDTTKNAQIREESGSYETLNDLLDVLTDIAVLGLPLDYVEKDMKTLKDITYIQIKKTIEKQLNIADMKCVIVGDDNIINNIK